MPEKSGHKSSILSLLIKTGRLLPQKLVSKFTTALALSLLLSLLDFAGIAILIKLVWSLTGAGNQINLIDFNLFSTENQLRSAVILTILFILKNLISLFIYRRIQKILYNIGLKLTEQRTQSLLLCKTKDDRLDSSNEVNEIFNLGFYFPDVILTSLIQIFNETLIAAAMIALAVYMNGSKLVLILLILLPLLYLGFHLIRKKLGEMGEVTNRTIPHLYDTILDQVHGNADIRLNRKEHYFIRRLSGFLKIIHRLRRKSAFTGTQLTFRVTESFVAILLLGLLWINLSYTGSAIMLAQISALGVIGFRIIPSMNRILGSANNLNQYRYVLDNLEDSQPVNPPFPEDEEFTFRDMELEGIFFSYLPDQPLFSNFSMRIEIAQIIGISGKSGSGKSTLAELIAGLRIPNQGKIYLNGESTPEWPVYSMIGVSMVQQEIHLLKGNIAQNIALSYDENIDSQRMEDALKKSALFEWVSALPNGLETQVGEWGNMISGGQKQRLAIARALYHRADLIIFDEATGALDQKTEAEIIETIKNLAEQGMAIILISHNKDVLSIAHKIIDLDK